jgi:hypothetical protein
MGGNGIMGELVVDGKIYEPVGKDDYVPILQELLIEVKKINLHLSTITGERIKMEDITC